MPAPTRTFGVRHLQLLRAALAAVAALMVTFSNDHSAQVGLSIFSGFAIASALVLVLSAWLVYPEGKRWWVLTVGAFDFIAGMVAGVPSLRTDDMFFALLISWALVTGAFELAAGFRLKGYDGARDQIITGGLGILLGITLLVVPAGFLQSYTIAEAGTFQLTGIIIGVGLFGGYAAIVAVLLGIAGLTPRPVDAETPASVTEADRGGAS
ncbi:acyl-CoA synthetase [Microbacterium bovistercoris]|uniref:Acyl-CoA synthetase n=1 Tax=Microbacterium bovistercoris TaxID=2293570 RepID=A0A371NPJ1_9MICO|nr:acyl-CoA synthetase [Microbacterium bovistercoris]REJ04116.1 acyl-CoA synthetase [Microbacterium bovistercoris]